MLKGAVGSRYAEALFAIASDQGNIDQLEEELQAIDRVIAGSRELQKVLYHPQITPEEKKEIVKNIFAGRISRTANNFLYLLIDHKREMFLHDIVAYFTGMANRARNLVQVEVTSAVELTEEEREKLNEVLEKITCKKVRAEYSVDPSLIGGVVVRIGDRVIDGSVKTRLAGMREHLRQIS
ncbi:MAG: F0F1 ATP synthase subunit delta [Bacillota bacterium]